MFKHWFRRRKSSAPGSSAAASPEKIPHAFSVYLDIVRLVAAVNVVLFHTWHRFYPDSSIRFPGHEAVVVFFVLSGYVIAYAASRPGVTLSIYLQHRIARIVPVAWAALALGLALSLEKGEPAFWPTVRNMVFLGQSGLWWTEAPLNSPFWSLNYEVWYYVIFAAWLYSPQRYRNWLVAAAMLIAGPKILLLFPIWLMGVRLYRRMPALSQRRAWTWYVASLCVAGLLFWFNIADLLRAWLYAVCPPAWRLHYSTKFVYDILLGLVVTVHFAAAAVIAPAFRWMKKLEKPIRYLAGFSFSIYVFHEPLSNRLFPGMTPVLFYAELAACIFILGQLTERRVGFFRRLGMRFSQQFTGGLRLRP